MPVCRCVQKPVLTGGGTEYSGWCGSPTLGQDHVTCSGKMSCWTGAVDFTFWPQGKLVLKAEGMQT